MLVNFDFLKGLALKYFLQIPYQPHPRSIGVHYFACTIVLGAQIEPAGGT
jgi:hypothetical protein